MHPALRQEVELEEERDPEEEPAVRLRDNLGRNAAKSGNLETSENDDIKMAINARGS